ncbi:MAG TPA: hypothetical protein VHD83_04640 [Puia sp.]|nr:hypothetical protein [Puia sp.]
MTHDSKKRYSGSLCQPLDPADMYEVFWEKRFPEEGVTISLRPLYLPADEPVLRELAIFELPEKAVIAESLFKTKKEELSMLALSDFGQSFLGMIDGQPAFLVVVHRMQQHIMGHWYDARPGDHNLGLERLPLIDDSLSEAYAFAVWQGCTDCLMEFQEVGRLVTALDIFRPSEKQYCRAAGFRPLARTGGSNLVELYCR